MEKYYTNKGYTTNNERKMKHLNNLIKHFNSGNISDVDILEDIWNDEKTVKLFQILENIANTYKIKIEIEEHILIPTPYITIDESAGFYISKYHILDTDNDWHIEFNGEIYPNFERFNNIEQIEYLIKEHIKNIKQKQSIKIAVINKEVGTECNIILDVDKEVINEILIKNNYGATINQYIKENINERGVVENIVYSKEDYDEILNMIDKTKKDLGK